MPDEGLQEIQLRGKQLVFLAMSATVVAVVIFLCGVMVGRGVPTARQAVAGPIEADADVLAPPSDTGAPATASGETTDTAGAGPAAPLEYPELVGEQPPAERPLKPSPPARPFAAETAVERADTPRRATAARAAEKDSAARATEKDVAAKTADAGGFQVQVAAYQREGDAATVRDRLARKGFPAFVTTATTSAGTWFRVRVGGYDTRNEAQAVATRLKREEQLDPWVTR
jgi:cell division septation protein DedD